MNTLKNIIKKLLGVKTLERIRNFRIKRTLKRNFLMDYKLYKKHSSVFNKDTYNKIESEITLRYHSIEKGFLYNPIRFRFAKKRVEELLNYLKLKDVDSHINGTQIQSAILNLCAYYELHSDNNIDISDYFLKDEYEQLKKKLITKFQPVKYHTSSDYFKYIHSDFEQFSLSRCSVREYTGEKISIDVFNKVVELANHAPSVCNRQGISVYLVDNKEKLDEILFIQGGLKGISANVNFRITA
jgi:hypothetical protein